MRFLTPTDIAGGIPAVWVAIELVDREQLDQLFKDAVAALKDGDAMGFLTLEESAS